MVYESNYRFHDPVRYFTANDPYYWEIDNIPLKQLMENDLWLKDQLDAGLRVTIDEIDRSGFSELKPYSLDVDNVVRVKPGRFTARINDPMVDFRLQELERIGGAITDASGSVFGNHSWKLATYATTSLSTAINKLTSVVADDALFMNGLYERAFAYETWTAYFPPSVSQNQEPTNFQGERFFESSISNGEGSRLHMPLADALLMQKDSTSTGPIFRLPDNYLRFPDNISNTRYFSHLTKSLDHHFIKFWRGVVRTAVVDVAEELSIEVPAFNLRDFDYYDQNGQVFERPEAEVRIDLLFIYSKPIDAPYVKLRDVFDLQNHRKIYKPELGLVKGAGVILRKNLAGGIGSYGVAMGGTSYATGGKILASVADSLNTSGGFSNEQVYGSFPAPDDLMNITPLLSEQLESNSPLLLGQSILPIAYIVVRKPQTVTTNLTVTNNDIIDIRPFFRTTELSYNERAGIAAAQPPISFVNPVVTRTNLKETSQAIKRYIDIKTTPPPAEAVKFPRVIAAGYVLGGTRFGPEAVIKQFEGNASNINRILVEKYGYPQAVQNINIDTPNWELARWIAGTNEQNQGSMANDYIDLDWFSGPDFSLASEGFSHTGPWGPTLIYAFGVRKTINIANILSNPALSWVNSYEVKATLFNCGKILGIGNADSAAYGSIAMPEVFVSKLHQDQSFRLEVLWPPHSVNDQGSFYDLQDANEAGWPRTFGSGNSSVRSDAKWSAGIIVPHGYIRNNPRGSGAAGQRSTGICSLPSVYFEIIGYESQNDYPFKTVNGTRT